MAYQPDNEGYAGYPPDALGPMSYMALGRSGHDGLPVVAASDTLQQVEFFSQRTSRDVNGWSGGEQRVLENQTRSAQSSGEDVSIDDQDRGEATMGTWDVDFANRLKDVIERTENDIYLPKAYNGQGNSFAEAITRQKAKIVHGHGLSSAYENKTVMAKPLPRQPRSILPQSAEQTIERPRFTLDRRQSVADRSKAPTISSTFVFNNIASFPETYIPPPGINFVAEQYNLLNCLYTNYRQQFTSGQLAHDFRLLWWYRWDHPRYIPYRHSQLAGFTWEARHVIPGHFPEDTRPNAGPIIPTKFTIKWQKDVEEWQRNERAQAGKGDMPEGQPLPNSTKNDVNKRDFATLNDLDTNLRSGTNQQGGSSSAKKAKRASTQTTPSKTFDLAALATANQGELNIVADILTELKQVRSDVGTSAESQTSTSDPIPTRYQNINSQSSNTQSNNQTQDTSFDDEESLFVTSPTASRQVSSGMESSSQGSSPTGPASQRPTTLVLPFSGTTISITPTRPGFPFRCANGESSSTNGYARPA